MAVAQGSGTGGTTKKKPDDPYFDSESPAGSNFKQAKGTSSSTGFKDKQTTADPYFSNTSPAGSTMSSDKSTWRGTNSGWNVPPSGGTAAQGGGTYNREAAAQSRSGSTVRDSNRDRGVTGDRASINTVISRDPGQEIAAPQFGKYDSPLVTLTNGSTVRQPNPNQNTWTPTLWGTDVNQKIQFSTPFTQQLGEAAQSAASAASNAWDRITGTGYPNMIADRQQRALDNNGPIIGELGATLVGIFGASEAAQKSVFSNYVPAAENARAVEDARGNVMIIGPNYARNTGVPVAEWEAQFGRDENGDLNTAPRTVAGEELDTTLSTGQAGSSVLGAWNKVFNFSNPNNVYVEKYGPDPNRTIFAPGAWDMFVQEIRNNVSGYDANNVYFNSLPPEDKRTVAQAYHDLQIHGPDAQLQGMRNLLTWDSQIENMRNAAELAYASNQPVIAAQMEAQANDMAKMSPTDIVEQQYNWGAEFAFAIGMPEPLDFVHLPVGAARIWGSRVLRDLGETISANAARKATEATVENADVAGKYAESMRLATEWVERAAGRESEAFKEWTGNADNIVGRMWSVTPETEITRMKYSFDDSYAAVLSHAGSQEEAKLLTRQFLQGKAFPENPALGRNPFTDPELIRDMGLISKYEEDILKLPSLNDGDFNAGRIQGEVSDFVQRQLVREFGLWPKDVPFGTTKIEAKPYVTKAGKTTSKFEVQFIGHDGKVISTRKGLFDTQAEAEKAAAAAKKAIDAEKPGWFKSFIEFQRTLLSTVFLYAPQFVIGNAMAASGAFLGDGVKSLQRSGKMLDKYAKMYGGAAPTGELLDVMKTEGLIEGTARAGQAAAGDAVQASKDGGVRTVWGVIQDKMPDPLKWTMELQDRVAKFFGNAAFGSQIGAEEFWRLNYFNYAFDQIHTYGRDEAASVFAAGLQTLGVDAALANRLVDAFYQASSEESARTVLTKLRELTGQAEIRAGLASLNIGPTTVSAAGWSRMEDLIETVDPQNKEALGAAIGEWLQQEFRDINTMMAGSELPPLPFREVFTNMESAQQGAQITEDIIRIGQRAGMTQDEARKAATSLAQGVFDSEMGEFEAIRKALGIDPTNDQLQGALVFYQKVMSERRRVIDKVDKLYARLNKAETKADAQAIFDEVNKLWGDYSANLKVWGNDLRTSTFAQVAPQQFVPAVGDTVRLTDGTEATVKQVLQENDMTSYVVTNAQGLERTANAAEIAPRAVGVQADFAQSVQQQQVASLYDNILDEYMTASGVEDDIAKIWSGQLAGQRSSDEWKTVKEASRKYLDSGRNNMLLSYGQYPSAEFFDEMLSAEMQINATSDHVVATLASRRDMARDGVISWNDYYKFRDETWRQWTEYAYAKYQYATVAGLRHTLGKGADDVLAKIPIQSVEPPFLSVDDVRRAQAIQEGKIPEGVRIPDKRIVASVKKHLGFDIVKLDDMTDEQLREAWRYYRKTATDNGINFEAQWFRYRMGEFAMFSGLADDMDAIETWWKVESAQYANGNAEIPNFGTARRQRVADAIDLARKVWDNIDEIAATTVPGVTPATRGEILKLINNTVASLDDIRYRASKAGQEAAAYGMLNYWKRRGFDKKLGYLFGYSYYQTRAPLNWARRIAQNPAIAYDLYQYNRALKGENQQQFDQGAPGRIEGTLPNPLKALFQNLGKMEGMPGQQAAAAIGDWMPARFYEPSKFVIPYGWPNDFIDPSQANNGFERNMMRALRFTPVLLPMYTIPIGMALDIFAPKDNSYSRMADVQVGDYSKSLRMGAYALQSVPKQPESSWASALNPILGNKAPGFLGDQFDTGRINRAIFTGVAAGKYDPDIGRLAIAQMDNAQLGLENIPEMNDPKMAAAIQEVVNGAINDAGMERFANLIMGYTLRMPGQDTSAIEMEVRRANQERSSLGYGFDNQFGSQAAVTQFTDQAKLSSGVPLNDALAAMWNYSGTYDPAVDDKYGRVDVQVINDMAREERSAVYDEMNKAVTQFIWENPTASEGEVSDFKQPYYDQVEALKLKYPSATIFDNADRYAYRSPHQNPYERAQAEIAAVIRYDAPGKPEWPGEDATPAAKDQYYMDLGEWVLKDLNVIDRVGEQWVQGEDTQPGKVTGDLQMARAVIGRTARELADTEALRYQSGIYIEWYMRENMAQAVRTANYADERERLTAEFGEDGYKLWQEYKAIPEDPSLEYPSWTPAHEAFIEDNPEVQAMKIYDASPETYSYMLRNGGDHVFEALAMYPGGGTKSEKRQWESRWGREKKAVYWYFGVNDTLKSSRSKAREEGQAIGEDWRNNMNNPAYTQGFEPIGIDPNAGTVRSRSDYDALAQGNTDYTTLGGARAVQAAQQNVSMQQPQGSVMSRSDINRIIPDLTRPAPTPGVNAPPATTPADLQAYQEAKADGTLTEWIAKREAAIDAGEDTGGTRSSSGYGSGYRGYWYRGRYYRRRRSYRRRSGGRRRYRSYSRGGRRGGYGGGYGGGGGGGYSTAEEQQPLYLRFDGPQQTYAREFATWLYPQSNNQTWRPTGINSGFTPPRGNVAIRPWRRINVRA